MDILKYILAMVLISSHLGLCAQLSDIITVKKKGRVVKNFGAGSKIHFTTINYEDIDGYISLVRDDSVFIKQYNIRMVPTQQGFNYIDTVAVYQSGYRYTDISSIQLYNRRGFLDGKLSTILMIGGAGYLLLNAVNRDHKFSEPSNLRTMAISAGVFGVGLLLNKTVRDSRFTGPKHRIEYIRLR